VTKGKKKKNYMTYLGSRLIQTSRRRGDQGEDRNSRQKVIGQTHNQKKAWGQRLKQSLWFLARRVRLIVDCRSGESGKGGLTMDLDLRSRTMKDSADEKLPRKEGDSPALMKGRQCGLDGHGRSGNYNIEESAGCNLRRGADTSKKRGVLKRDTRTQRSRCREV